MENKNIRKLHNLDIEKSPFTLQSKKEFIFNYVDELELPLEVERMLCVGPNFSLPIELRDINIPALIADFEDCIQKNVDCVKKREVIRSKGINIITNFYHQVSITDCLPTNINILKDFKITQQFVKNHPEILIGRSDKGNTTVVVKREEYFNEMKKMFDDKSLYATLNSDPTAKFERKCKELIKELVKCGAVSKWRAEFLKNNNSPPPKAYGLRKTHKVGKIAYRPVISNIDSPTYAISKYIHGILANVCSTFHRSVKNSFQVVSILKDVILPDDYIFISLDVVSLFPSIPKKLILEIISSKWNWFANYTEIPKSLFLKIIEFLFESSYFVIDGSYYILLDGSPMGAPCSPSIANILMEVLVSHVLSTVDFEVPVALYYVDDSLFAIPSEKTSEFVQSFNNFNEKIQFTSELEVNQRLPFLDIEVIRNNDGSVMTNWYVKPTASGRMLNYLSLHPTTQKVNTVKNLLHRVHSLSHESFWQQNLTKIRRVLKDNNYPTSFVNRIINEFGRKNMRKTNEEPSCQIFSKIPNIPILSNNIKRMLMKEDIGNVAVYNTKTTRSLFSKIKHKDEKMMTKNLVYKFDCVDCNKIYIGESKQKISSRIYQHKHSCKPTSNVQPTALSIHSLELEHTFDFDNFQILAKESDDKKRKILEAIHIIGNREEAVNFKTDVDKVGSSYNYIIDMWLKKEK